MQDSAIRTWLKTSTPHGEGAGGRRDEDARRRARGLLTAGQDRLRPPVGRTPLEVGQPRARGGRSTPRRSSTPRRRRTDPTSSDCSPTTPATAWRATTVARRSPCSGSRSCSTATASSVGKTPGRDAVGGHPADDPEADGDPEDAPDGRAAPTSCPDQRRVGEVRTSPDSRNSWCALLPTRRQAVRTGPRRSSCSSRQRSVSATWLNVKTCNPSTCMAGSENALAHFSTKRIGS